VAEHAPLVLIVDDDEAARFAKASVLRRAGFDVLQAGTGREGLTISAERSPDVIVLDVNLPDMSGFEVARQLRDSSSGRPGVPILQVSSTAITTADRVQGLEAGADVYLTEPVAGEILVATVRALRRVRAAEQALAAALGREREARQIAEEASRLKDEFIATLSHELRTPLNALMGWIYQLRHSGLDERSRQRALESLERNARVQAQLINDLLDISRISKGKLHLRMELIDLRTVLNDAVDSVRAAVESRRLALGALAHEACWVVGDYGRLQQIVTNLLTNAIQFTPEGGRVDVDVRPHHDTVELTVTDSGVGIESDLLPHVFDQFRQGTAGLARKHGGLGLGLSVVRQLVELHGGSVEVASRGLGNGSTFTITLPREVDGLPAGPDDRGQPVLLGVQALVVHRAGEDIAATLDASGAHSTSVADAAAAKAAVADSAFDVIVGERPADLTPSIASVFAGAQWNAGKLVRDVRDAVRRANARTIRR
jgi:signal transduction histidine kinase